MEGEKGCKGKQGVDRGEGGGNGAKLIDDLIDGYDKQRCVERGGVNKIGL